MSMERPYAHPIQPSLWYAAWGGTLDVCRRGADGPVAQRLAVLDVSACTMEPASRGCAASQTDVLRLHERETWEQMALMPGVQNTASRNTPNVTRCVHGRRPPLDGPHDPRIVEPGDRADTDCFSLRFVC